MLVVSCGGAEEKGAACSRHAECASAVCDIYKEADGNHGVCVDESTIIYVDNGNEIGCESADGTQLRPFCTVDEARSLLGGERRAIRLAASTKTYGQLRGLTDVVVTFYGPDEGGEASFSSGEEDVTAVWISGASDVTLDGITIRSAGGGARCESAPGEGSFAFRRSAVRYADGPSLSISGCELMVDRALLANARDLKIVGGSRYRITNSVITGHSWASSRPTLTFSDDSGGTFALNTVVGNASFVQCGATSRRLEDSIFINPEVSTPSQFSGACVLERVVVGTADATTSRGAIRIDPEFVNPEVDNYHLTRSPTNRACCIDRAARRPDARTDYDGERRPKGAGFDIGADEVE